VADARVTRRRFIGLASGAGAAIAIGPLATDRARAVESGAGAGGHKGIAPGNLLYLAPGEVLYRLDMMESAAPGGWVRTDVDWGSIESSPGSFDWTAADRVVRGAVDRGLRVIAILGTTPRWANAGLGWDVPPFTPESMRPFLRAAAARYAPLGVVFEIWNEPNYRASWRWPDPAAYAALLRVAYDTIKSVAPTATVLTGGLASGGGYDAVAFVEGIYAHGAGKSFDGLGYHPYCGSSPPLDNGSGLRRTLDLRNVLVAHGDAAKAVWGTEIGWRVQLLGITESQQATYLSQAYSQWRSWSAEGWVGPLLWYNLRDESVNPLDPHTFSGLYRNNWTARPAWLALRSA
jgi:hypothetical protein